jgi:uncharacterized protein (TIGR02996 family)
VEETFLQALHAEPNDEMTWLALADWLEEDGQQHRAELVRLVRRLRSLPGRTQTQERTRMQARVAELLNAGVRPVAPEVVNSIGMRFALIPPGGFLMGSRADEEGRQTDEGPMHEVEISTAFYLGVFPVTQAQWQTVMGSNPSCFCATGSGKHEVEGMSTDDFPVERVSWEDVTEFLKTLAALETDHGGGREYRLPAEAEWEYACRGGPCSSTPFHLGKSLSSRQADFNGYHPYGGAASGPDLRRTCQVGSYRPNAFGLYDMHGNVFEWCSDWFGFNYYEFSPRRDPHGPYTGTMGSLRVIRGGSWSAAGQGCRSAARDRFTQGNRSNNVGFRVVLIRTD